MTNDGYGAFEKAFDKSWGDAKDITSSELTNKCKVMGTRTFWSI